MPGYSIILPVRNGGEYVKLCVQSILSQTFTDFNLIVLDNASTDGTREWISSLNDKRIILHPSSRSLTIEENWGRVLSVPKNEFMTLIGHDDILNENFLSVINDLVTKHPGASVYHTHFTLIDAKGAQIRSCKPMEAVQNTAQFLASYLSDKIDVMGTGYVMRSADYDKCGGIPAFPNLLFADFALWTQLTRKGYMAIAPETCFSFRIHQSTTTQSPDVKFHQAFDRFMHYLGNLKKEDKDAATAIEKNSLVFIDKFSKGLAHRLLRTPLQKREGLTVASFLNKCKGYADMLSPGNNYDPSARFSLKLAKFIDSNSLTRRMFLLFRKVYSRPVYS